MSNSVNTVETNILANSAADVKSEKDEIQDEIDSAVEVLFNNCKPDLLVGDYLSSLLGFEELFDQKYGLGLEERDEVSMCFVNALTVFTRRKRAVFGNRRTKLTALSDSEEGNESQDSEQSSDQKSEEKKTETEDDIRDSDEVKETTAQQSSNVSEPSTCLPSKSSPNDENNDQNEVNGAFHLELVWEVLSFAKHLLKSEDKLGIKLKLSEALQKLGEISIELVDNGSSIRWLTRSLALRKELLSEDDPSIADIYYQLGLAFSVRNDCENANNCFQSAIQVIEARIVNTRKKMCESNEGEITQLEVLLPEMRLKIEVLNDQMKSERKALEDEKDRKVKEDAIALKSQEVKEKPITETSHLIKRKRQNSDTETTPKKVCSNGHKLMNDDKSSDQTHPSI